MTIQELKRIADQIITIANQKDLSLDVKEDTEYLSQMIVKAFREILHHDTVYREPSDWDHHFETPEETAERDARIERKRK